MEEYISTKVIEGVIRNFNRVVSSWETNEKKVSLDDYHSLFKTYMKKQLKLLYGWDKARGVHIDEYRPVVNKGLLIGITYDPFLDSKEAEISGYIYTYGMNTSRFHNSVKSFDFEKYYSKALSFEETYSYTTKPKQEEIREDQGISGDFDKPDYSGIENIKF